MHKGKVPAVDYNKINTTKLYNSYSLVALKSARFDQKYMEKTRLRLKRSFKKEKDMFWSRINTSIPVTKKPDQIRMGKGKGKVVSWIARIPAGRVLLEVASRRKGRALIMARIVARTLKIPAILSKTPKAYPTKNPFD